MKRLFIAVETSDAFRSWLEDCYGRVTAALSGADRDSFREVSRANLHVTLHFLGDTEERDIREIVSEIEHVCRPLPPMHLKAVGFGAFPSTGRPRVLWIGVHPDSPAGTDLERLHRLSGDALTRLGRSIDRRPFQPHITVAYARKRARPENLRTAAARCVSFDTGASPEFDVRDVVLFESVLAPGGARYTPIARAPLAAI